MRSITREQLRGVDPSCQVNFMLATLTTMFRPPSYWQQDSVAPEVWSLTQVKLFLNLGKSRLSRLDGNKGEQQPAAGVTKTRASCLSFLLFINAICEYSQFQFRKRSVTVQLPIPSSIPSPSLSLGLEVGWNGSWRLGSTYSPAFGIILHITWYTNPE